jgi:hypothetical protein
MNDALVGLIIFALGFGAGWSWQGSRADVRVDTLITAQEKSARTAATTAAEKLKAAQDRTDAITEAAAARSAAQTAKLQETQNALKTATRNRPCLGAPALRLLGQSPGLRLGPADRALAGAPDRRPAAAAADPADEGDYATDTQLADWIATAGDLYERCRSRIRDIRTWSEGTRD